MGDLYTWCADYLDAIPPPIRSTVDDSRFVAAARRARDNGWTPQQAARAVTARTYDGARNPILLAIIRLEQTAEHQPGTPPPRRRNPHPNGCPVCTAYQPCADPAQAIPPEWAAERFQRIAELRRIPTSELGEDERGELMAQLIAHQKERAGWSTSG